MFTFFAATCCFSCSSGDSDEDSIENNAVEDNLPTETKMFVGYWMNETNTTKGGNFIFFSDGNCFMYPLNEDGRVDGYWTYDSSTKILATTTNLWQWQVTLSNSDAWAGVSLGSSSVQTFKKNNDKKAFFEKLLENSSWISSNDSVSIGNYRSIASGYSDRKGFSYVSGWSLSGSLDFLTSTTLMQVSEDDNEDDNVVLYELYRVGERKVAYTYKYNYEYYLMENLGSGTIEFFNPTNISKSTLRFTGYIDKSFKRDMNNNK
jgi:hypothetical protein